MSLIGTTDAAAFSNPNAARFSDDFDFFGLCPLLGYTGAARLADDAQGGDCGGGAPYTGLYCGGEPKGPCSVECDGICASCWCVSMPCSSTMSLGKMKR